MQQFPSRDELILLVKDLDGYVITPSDSQYANEIKMYNSRVDRFPFAVVMVKSIKDIKAVLQMAKKYDLLISIRSSGHSFIGSSTHDGSIVINLKNMKGIRFNLNSTRNPAGEVTVESGNTWLDVYKEVDKQVTQDRMGNSIRRVIAGGSAHAVAMGGYTQGGGHSPMGRRLGLAVDNLLEATIILADGRKAVVSAQGIQLTDFNGNVTVSNDTSLFWAIRGGGGGTWGVVVDFTFKLHFAPQRIRNVGLNWALRYQGHDIGSDTIRFVMQQVANLSSDWGGYVTIYGGPLNNESSGSLSVFLNHFGANNSSSNNEINQLLDYNPHINQYLKFDRNFSTFLQYEMTVSDPEFVNTYVFDSFIQPGIVNDSQKLGEFVRFGMDLLNSPPYSIYSCTGALIGGKMREVPDGETPVHPKFRSGLLAMTCGIGWPAGTGYDDYFIGNALEMQDRLAQLGNGSYFNEAAEDLADWKTQFWGTSETYNRLLYVKRKWDPENFFWCHNCVGSDEKAVCPRRAAGGWVFLPGASN